MYVYGPIVDIRRYKAIFMVPYTGSYVYKQKKEKEKLSDVVELN